MIQKALLQRVSRIEAGFLMGLLLSLLAGVTGCGLFMDSADQHQENAEAYLREGRTQEALIEFYHATRLKPDNLELTLRAAEVFAESGHHLEAVDFYRDALSLNPEDPEIALRLGGILAYTDPAAAETISNELTESKPGSAEGWLLKSRLALIRNETNSARSLAEKAEKMAPYDPEISWTRAEIEEAVDRNAQVKNPLARVSPNQLNKAANHYENYLRKGGTRELEAELRRAKVLSRIGGAKKEEGLKIYQRILNQPMDAYPRGDQISAFRQIMKFAIRTRDPDLAQQTLDRWIQLAPQDLQAWSYQASLYQGAPTAMREAAYQRILESADDNLGMQVVYAEYLTSKLGLESGIAFLRDRLSGDDRDATLLAQIVNLQHAAMRLRDAGITLNQFQNEFPEDPLLPQVTARHALLNKDYSSAIQTINQIPDYARGSLEYQIAANALMKQGLNQEALEQIRAAQTLSAQADPATLRLKAQIEFNLREYRRAAASLIQLRRISPLSIPEEIMLARSYYASRAPGIGRKMLTRVLDQNPGQATVAMELYNQEDQGSNRPDIVKKALSDALDKDPQNMEILEALTEIDLNAGRNQEAMARVNRVIEPSNWIGPPYLVRARIHLSEGRVKDARNDAERARLLTPRIAEQSFEIQALAYLASGDPSRPIAMLEKAAAAGNLTADRTALLARLQMHSGQPERAIELYERALQGGSRFNHVKNDLALLLAEHDGDLEKAEKLALVAVEAPGDQIDANDTLGYVYLKQGRPDLAYWKFRYVIDNAKTPRADYYYHLALALIEMERPEEARTALSNALEIDPRFEPASELNARLEQEASAQAS